MRSYPLVNVCNHGQEATHDPNPEDNSLNFAHVEKTGGFDRTPRNRHPLAEKLQDEACPTVHDVQGDDRSNDAFGGGDCSSDISYDTFHIFAGLFFLVGLVLARMVWTLIKELINPAPDGSGATRLPRCGRWKDPDRRVYDKFFDADAILGPLPFGGFNRRGDN